MKTRKIEVCDGIFVDVVCEFNDSTDIECGGPATLGYEFFISPDDKDDIKSNIMKFLKKYNRPFIGMSFIIYKDFPVKNLWSLEKIEECIKSHDV
jgi:hypothetical protein